MPRALLFLFLLAAVPASAQKIYGTVFTATGDLLPFSSITIKGTSIGASANEKGKYSFDYAGSGESGKYHISNNELFTTPDGGIQMMVKIEKLTTDTLVMQMNRGGTAEKLTLVRK